MFVERAVAGGSRINDIAQVLNVTDDTLRKHFRYEIMTARERLKADAVRVIMDNLQDGSLDAAKYVMARVGGWTEKQAHEHSGPNGGPIMTESAVDLSRLTDAQLEHLSGILAIAGGSREGD